MTTTHKHQIVIVGGGTAGITVAAQLQRKHQDRNFDIVIIEPSEKHYYQPMWTLVGGGIFPKEKSCRDEKDYIPQNVKWLKEKVVGFHPTDNFIELGSGDKVAYEFLIVCPGIQIDWHKIDGLTDTLGKNGVSSNYSYETVHKTWENIHSLKEGVALFTQPGMPIKCAGAPQKTLYLAEDYFRKNNLRNKVDVQFALAGPRIFGVEKYRNALEHVLERKEINPFYEHNLIAVRGESKEAIFMDLKNQKEVVKKFDMLHAVPPMSSPDFIKQSLIADKEGWVDVDKYTTQHNTFKNIFSLGDASSLPTSRTGAAIRKEAPVLVENLISYMDGKPLNAKYDGYSSCPIVTGYGSLILAEFDYDGNPVETFPFDQAQERYSMYLLKLYGLPLLYWEGMLKGRA